MLSNMEHVQGHVLVELDDGDSRLVDISRIRMLPHNYSRVGQYLIRLSAIYIRVPKPCAYPPSPNQ